MPRLFAQGDILLERVPDAPVSDDIVAPDWDGAVVLARGEATGHRHAFHDAAKVTLYRDWEDEDCDVPENLYVGHLRVCEAAELRHNEHQTILIPAGTYIVRRQREHDGYDDFLVSD